MGHIAASAEQLTPRIRRIAGQVAAIERAISSGSDCAVVLQQVAAARGALAGLMDELIADFLQEHVVRADLSDEDRRAGAEQLITAIRRYSK